MPHPRAKGTEAEIIESIETVGMEETARRFKVGARALYERRKRLERRIGRQIKSPIAHPSVATRRADPFPDFLRTDVTDGIVLVGSDSHYRRGHITTAHRAFVHFAREMQPKVVVKNGDELDGAAISRHPPSGTEYVPSVQEEIEEAQARLTEIEKAAPNAKRFWPVGNHDNRWPVRLATAAPEFARVHGFNLSDHFPYWRHTWALWLNDDVMVKHRWKGGKHAPHNNAVESGRTMITGHLHSLKVSPWTDYTGTRWGVDCGTLADPFGPQFRYAESSPRNWRSGFIVLTFWRGRLLWPELVHVIGDGLVEFRGQVIEVGDGKAKARK